MRIEGNQPRPGPQGRSDAVSPKGQRADSADTSQGVSAELGSQSVLQPYVTQAKAEPEVNEQAVAEARNLLESGQLDGPEAIRRAAQAMIRRGL